MLLPVGPSRVLGAHGSDWRTHALITNTGNTPAQVNGALDPSCHLPICAPPPPLPPQASFVMVEGAPDCGGRGAFLYVEAARARDIAITLRSRDHSRALETWGTTVPVVYPSALFSQAIGITDIPVEAQFRGSPSHHGNRTLARTRSSPRRRSHRRHPAAHHSVPRSRNSRYPDCHLATRTTRCVWKSRQHKLTASTGRT